MKGTDEPIITSLLDLDFYKLTMGQFVFLRHRDVPVRYAFRNRTHGVRLAYHVAASQLREELNHVCTLQYTEKELDYLPTIEVGGQRVFRKEYCDFLKSVQLPDYALSIEDGQFKLEFEGPWATTIYWETLALSIVNELYYRAKLARMETPRQRGVLIEGGKRLREKIATLKPRSDVSVTDFGTRRRFSRAWHEQVVTRMAEALPQQFTGTSNVLLAKQLNLKPIGTLAHELFMAYFGIYYGDDVAVCDSHNRVLRDWEEVYGPALLIALTDTYGADFFFRNMTREQAMAWSGLRHDSGDPFRFGQVALGFYARHGVSASDKTLVFSDGLELPLILKLANEFKKHVRVAFGWGTNLTNDLGLEALALVVKLVEAAGHETVKLSDNLAKATGPASEVARVAHAVGYKTAEHERVETKY